MRSSLRPLLTAACFLITADVFAQFAQYTPPGGPGERPVDRQSEVESNLDNARFRLGPLRLAPWFGLSRLTYTDDVFATLGDGGEKTSDLNAVLGAGLELLLPTGPKTVWTAEGGLEYSYWNDLEERRELRGRAGGAVYGFYNRLRLEAGGGFIETEEYASAEQPQQLPFRTEHVRGSLAVDLSRKIELWTRGRAIGVTALTDELNDPRVPDFGLLDRDETVLAGGLAWRPTDAVRLGLGVERSEVEFGDAARNLDNEGTAPIATLDLIGNRIELRLTAVQRTLDPVGDSEFVPFETTTGSFRLDLDLSHRFDLQLYGHRGLVYSLEDDYGYLTDQRLGATVRMPLGHRVGFRLFAETGENDYSADDPAIPDRTDDVTSYGARLSIDLGRYLTFNLGARETAYDSNRPGFDRTVGTVESGLTLRVNESLIWR